MILEAHDDGVIVSVRHDPGQRGIVALDACVPMGKVSPGVYSDGSIIAGGACACKEGI